MKRTTISLPDDLAVLVLREAGRRQTSVSELVRVALKQLLRPEGGREIPWAGLVREPQMVYGARLDEALAEEWPGDEGSSDSGARLEKGAADALVGGRR